MNKIVFIIIFITLPSFIFAQVYVDGNDDNDFHFGIATKLNIEFHVKRAPSFKLSVVGGVGYNIQEAFFPTIQSGIILFNRGSIGSNAISEWYTPQAHFFYSFLTTFSLDRRNFNYTDRFTPLYHFADFTANPLQNPFKSSISWGLIKVHVQDNENQRLAFINGNVTGRVQVSYYNDGGIPLQYLLADKYDRFYTGGFVFSYHGNENHDVNLVELSYHKYTGYSRYAYNVSNHYQLDFLLYQDTRQFAYNQSQWRLNIGNFRTGYGGNISLYNYSGIDIQHFIHFKLDVTYHPDYYQSGRVMFGGNKFINYLKLSD